MWFRGRASAAGLMAVALALTLALSACGGEGEASADEQVASLGESAGGGDDPAASQTAENRREGALEFAQCMREHGIDHPDPDENGMFRITPDGDGKFDPQSAEFREAADACEKYLGEMGPPPELSAEERKKLEEQMLAFARCMRKEGIDMPDPKFNGEGGGFTFEIGPGGLDPNDADFRAAEQACRKYSPERNPPNAEGQ